MMGFVALLIGIVLVQQIGDDVVGNTELSSKINESITITTTSNTIINESIDITAAGGGHVGNSSVISVTFFGSGNKSTGEATIEVGVDVNFTRTGNITVNIVNFSTDVTYNISYIYVSAGIGQTDQDDVTAVTFFGNTSLSTFTADIDINDEINFTKPGVISVATINFSAGSYNIIYTYEGDLFVTDSTSRTFLKLVPLFFVLAILMVAFIMFRDAFPEFLGGK